MGTGASTLDCILGPSSWRCSRGGGEHSMQLVLKGRVEIGF